MFLEGESWYYNNAANEDSFCILNIIENTDGEKVYHISVLNVLADGEYHTIWHMPFSHAAILRSLTKKRSDTLTPPSKQALYGLKEWRAAKGGVWDIEVWDAVNLTV